MPNRFLLIASFLLSSSLWPQCLLAQDNRESAIQRPKLVAQLGHPCEVTSVAISSNGKHLITGSVDKTARLWDLATGRELRTFSGHRADVTAAVISSDGRYVATGSQDRSARLWDLHSGQTLREFQGHTDLVTSVALLADHKHLVTGSLDDTARLWDLSSGKVVHVFRGHTAGIRSVMLHADGKHLVSGSEDGTARLWDLNTGASVRVFKVSLTGVTSVALSADGKQLATGSRDSSVQLWDLATAARIGDFKGHKAMVRTVALSHDGRFVASGSLDKTARVWELATGKTIQILKGHSERVETVAFSPDSQYLATGSVDETAALWQLSTGKKVQEFHGQTHRVYALAISPDGKHLATGNSDDNARIWDLTTGKQTHVLKGHYNEVTSVAFSSDGKQLVTGSTDETARLWNWNIGKGTRTFPDNGGLKPTSVSQKILMSAKKGVNSGAVAVAISPDGTRVYTGGKSNVSKAWEINAKGEASVFKDVRPAGHFGSVTAVTMSRDGKYLITGGSVADIRVWDLAAQKQKVLNGHRGGITSLHLSADGKQLLSGSQDHTCRLWDLATAESTTFEGHSDVVTSVALTSNSKFVVTSSQDGTCKLWDATTAKEIRDFKGHTDGVTSLAVCGDDKLLITGSWDKTCRLWELDSGKHLCEFISFGETSWAVVDPDGRFDASDSGHVAGLHWVVGNEPIALSQLKVRYHEPGLLAKYLGFNKQPFYQVQPLRDVKLYPAAQAKLPEKDSSIVTLDLTNQGGGIGKVQVFVNGRELLEDARGPQVDRNAAKATLTVDLASAVVIQGQSNRVRVVTWNNEGYLSSRGLDFDWIPEGPKKEQPTELHVIVAGVSSYANNHLNLRFSGKDAEDMAKALATGGKRYLGADKVHVTLLCDADTKALPTRTNLQKAFEDARKARPKDILVVYLAGHGVGLKEDGQDIYCYLTKDAQTADPMAYLNPSVREQSSLSSTELTDWLKKIPALKQVLILDTCAAGAAAGKLMEHREISADQIRAIDRMRDRTGFHVLMGCAADRVSYEASRYSQGLLTHALLKGMRGAVKFHPSEEHVDVSTLFQYAADEVPQLAKHIGGIQKPLVLAPRGTSFDIGRLQKDDKKLIPLALERSLLLRPVLQNADENIIDDDLGLMSLLRRKLTDENFAAHRGGKGLGAVYVDADEMPEAIRPSGRYIVAGKAVRVTVLLRRDGREVGRVQVEGTRDDLPALVSRLAAAITERATTIPLPSGTD